METSTAQARFAQLEAFKNPFLNRAFACAELTIPSLFPRVGHTGASDLPSPYQSLGARGVNNISAKLLLALLPPNSPFFKMIVNDFAVEELAGEPGMRAKVEEALGKIERAVMSEIESRAMRVGVHEAIKLLVVTGNVLLFISPDGHLRVFNLNRFVVKRDPMGNVLEIIAKETVSPNVIPEIIREKVKGSMTGDEKTVDLYTHISRGADNWTIYQEAKAVRIPGSDGSYPLDKSPWLPLRWSRIDGEDYGRGHVEEYFGDLKSLEGLSQAIVEGSAIAAKCIPLVNPNGVTDEEELAEADNGAFVTGVGSDVEFLQVDKFADFRVALETMRDLTERLSFAFMLNSAIQRNGERVTAEEIRYMAGELEDALGATYSILAQEFQLPFVTNVVFNMERQKKLPALPKGAVSPTITTGLEALGRGHDLNKLDTFIKGLADTLGPEVLQQYLNVSDYIMRRGTALGIDTVGLVRTEEEIQAEREAAKAAAQQQEMMSKLGPNAINQMGSIAQKGMEQPNG